MGTAELRRVSSGIPGLDTLLRGGFVEERMYLILGEPGTGKTLLGMSFLADGLRAGENVLFIHSEESKSDILVNGSRVNIDLSDADFLDLGPDSEFFSNEQSYELVNPRDIASEQVVEAIRESIEELDPDRVLFDPLTQLQTIEPNEAQYRKRLVSFMRFLRGRGTTVLATQTPGSGSDNSIKSLSDGIIELQRGETGRRIAVRKHRGVGQRDGTHGFEIRSDGPEVYPALDPTTVAEAFEGELLHSGIEGFDKLLGGGIERGTVTAISGPTGVGKTTLSLQFLETAASQGRPVSMYQFEENIGTLTHRAESLGIPLSAAMNEKQLRLEEVEPLSLSPEEFAQQVKHDVEARGTEIVVIDGIEGYKLALHGEEQDLQRSLHALTQYLQNVNVAVIIVAESEPEDGLVRPTSGRFSYLVDTVLALNYIERNGQKDRIAGVLEKRAGDHEETVRPFRFGGDGLEIEEPDTSIGGFLTGLPVTRDGE